MICKDLKELEKELYKRINIALETDVSDTVKNVMTDHIAQDVYGVYTPTAYHRRGNNEGLLDPDNIVSTIGNNGQLFVQNVTLGSESFDKNHKRIRSYNRDKFLAPIIETGIGYDIGGWAFYEVPRPFMKNTYEDLIENHYHIKAMKNSLKKQGLEVI